MDKLLKLRKAELELLEAFMTVCKRQNLTWYAMFGTLLGAARDGGFMLRDDDIDVALPYEDYLKLCNNKNWFDERYFLQTPLDENQDHCVKIRKNGTTAFHKPLRESLRCGGHHGICIDILPLYEIYDSGYYSSSSVTAYPKNLFGKPQKLQFEHLQINVPQEYRKVLTLTYGYWNWPSGAEKVSPHYWFYDTERDYSEYVKKYTGWLKDVEDKKIYLFGAGDSLRIWLKDFNLREQVICTFDNDSTRWGTVTNGVPVRNPADLPSLLDENSRVIITSIWHNEIEKQLEEMGINDYFIFLDGLFDTGIQEKK